MHCAWAVLWILVLPTQITLADQPDKVIQKREDPPTSSREMKKAQVQKYPLLEDIECDEFGNKEPPYSTKGGLLRSTKLCCLRNSYTRSLLHCLNCMLFRSPTPPPSPIIRILRILTDLHKTGFAAIRYYLQDGSTQVHGTAQAEQILMDPESQRRCADPNNIFCCTGIHIIEIGALYGIGRNCEPTNTYENNRATSKRTQSDNGKSNPADDNGKGGTTSHHTKGKNAPKRQRVIDHSRPIKAPTEPLNPAGIGKTLENIDRVLNDPK